MRIERIVTRQKPLCFPVFSLFIFFCLKRRRKEKGNSKAKVLECTFAKTDILKTYDKNKEIKKEDTGVT